MTDTETAKAPPRRQPRMVGPQRPDPMRFERLQEAGAKRHPQTWLMANTAAVHAAMGQLDMSQTENKELVSAIGCFLGEAGGTRGERPGAPSESRGRQAT